MAATNDTVHGRIETARTELTPLQIATGLLFAAAIAFTLVDTTDSHESLTASS